MINFQPRVSRDAQLDELVAQTLIGFQRVQILTEMYESVDRLKQGVVEKIVSLPWHGPKAKTLLPLEDACERFLRLCESVHVAQSRKNAQIDVAGLNAQVSMYRDQTIAPLLLQFLGYDSLSAFQDSR